MSFGEAIKSVFSKYATFSGRARRSEYWYFILFNLIVSWGLYFVDDAISPERHVFGRIYTLFVLIPGLAVMLRRLHDIGRNGLVFVFWYLLTCVLAMLSFFILTRDSILDLDSDSFFFIGLSLFLCIDVIALLVLTIIWIIWMFRDSQPVENQWGPNPKGQTEVPSTTQLTDSTKDDIVKVNDEDKLVIDDAVYQLESHVAFGSYNGTCQLDAAEPVADGAEPSYSFHADIEKRTFNTTINFPGGEWIFCHFRFKSKDLEFGPENFTIGTLIITKDDAGFSFKGDGKLDTGQSVSFYIYVPTENYSNMGKTE